MSAAPPAGVTVAGVPWVAAGRRRLPAPAAGAFDPPPALPALAEPAAAVAAALDAPLGAPPLAALAAGARAVALVVPDSSRGCPVAMLLPPLLERLSQAGVGDDRMRVVIGCGLHRTTTPAEREALVGAAVARRLPVDDAQGLSPRNVELGVVPGGGPIVIDEAVAGADLVIAVGIVEPHLYAGFSGGVKAVAIGCAGRETIAWTHHPVFLDRPEVRLCRLDGNPFQEALRAIAGATSLRFAVNVVVGGGGVAGVAAGDPAAAQRRLVADHSDAWVRPHEAPFDLVIAGVPEPKDRSLYQASRAATYVGLSARPVLAPGGLVAFCAAAPLGVGDGPGETNFGALLAGTRRPLDLVARGCVEPLGPGGQRAYMMAKLMTQYRVGVIGARDPDLVESLGLLAFATIDEAVAAARRVRGPRARVLAVADGIDTVVELDA